MQIIHEEPELTTPFDIRTDLRRSRSALIDIVMDRFWWVVLGYVGTVVVQTILVLL